MHIGSAWFSKACGHIERMPCMNLQRKGEETKHILKTEYNIMANRDRFKVM